MVDKSRSEREQAAREEFNIIAQSPEGEKTVERWEYTKRKRAQLENGIANVVSFKDNVTKRKYTISVNATFTGDGDEELLVELQKSITAFLNNIHEKL